MATSLAQRSGFSETDAGRVAIASTEAATNLLKHAGEGEVLLHALIDGNRKGLHFIALDAGPGIAAIATALRDGFSTAGTAGSGLGAIARQSTSFDLYSVPKGGTVLLARFWTDGEPRTADRFSGGVGVAKPGQEACGDEWLIVDQRDQMTVLVVDGLGHGPGAAEAALRAKDIVRTHAGETPLEIVQRLHSALRPTRGAAAAVARIERGRRVVRFCGIGNIAGVLVLDGTTRSTVSHHGTLGHDVRKIQEFQYPWPPGGALVLHSDGLMSRWTLDRYPGLEQRDATLIAAVLSRDARRGNDDATAVVVRDAP
jgi:anti-sigma regulatory factor (Ser/Thr protein kinase)